MLKSTTYIGGNVPLRYNLFSEMSLITMGLWLFVGGSQLTALEKAVQFRAESSEERES